MFNNCYNLKTSPQFKIGTTEENKIIKLTCDRMFNNCSTLTGIFTEFNNGKYELITAIDMFYNCEQLKTFPDILTNDNLSILQNIQGICFNCINISGEIPSSFFEKTQTAENFNNCFTNCINISGIQINSTLSKNLKSANGLFQNCSSLINIPNDFWSTINETKNIDILLNNICNNCLQLTSYIPPEYLWANPNKRFQSNSAFKNCIKIQNFDVIPPEWK